MSDLSVPAARALTRRYAELDRYSSEADRIIDDTETPRNAVISTLAILRQRRPEVVQLMDQIDQMSRDASDTDRDDIEDALPEYTGDLVAGWDAMIESAEAVLAGTYGKSLRHSPGAHSIYR